MSEYTMQNREEDESDEETHMMDVMDQRVVCGWTPALTSLSLF